MLKEEPQEETDTLELAEVQADINEATDSSKKLEDVFEDDMEGRAYRQSYTKEALTDKVSLPTSLYIDNWFPHPTGVRRCTAYMPT